MTIWSMMRISIKIVWQKYDRPFTRYHAKTVRLFLCRREKLNNGRY